MLEHRPRPTPRPRPLHPPFARIVCLVEVPAEREPAITHTIAMAGADARVLFVATAERGAQARIDAVVQRARSEGVTAEGQVIKRSSPEEALAGFMAREDLIVVSAHTHHRVAGIVLGETATQLVHHSAIPVLVARERPLSDGVLAATRARPADRHALTTATRIAARLGAQLTVVHVQERHDDERKTELQAELANARALLGRPLDVYTPTGPTAPTIVDAAEGDGCGLIVVGSRGRTGLPAVTSVSERVAHHAPCSVLVIRDR